MLANPRIGARSSVRPSVAGEDSRKERLTALRLFSSSLHGIAHLRWLCPCCERRFFRRFCRYKKRQISIQNDETIFRCPARAMRDRPQPGNERIIIVILRRSRRICNSIVVSPARISIGLKHPFLILLFRFRFFTSIFVPATSHDPEWCWLRLAPARSVDSAIRYSLFCRFLCRRKRGS